MTSSKLRPQEAAGWIVLVVDDVSDNLSIIEKTLEHYGAKVHTADSAEEGMKILEQVTPTVILLDIRMPKTTGWDMFRTLRAGEATAHIPIIAVTAYAMGNEREQILAAGFDGYISKPIDIFSFVGQIKRVLAQQKPGGG